MIPLFLSDEQLVNLEKHVVAAEQELNVELARGGSVSGQGPATQLLEFKALEWLRRLLDDVKRYRQGQQRDEGQSGRLGQWRIAPAFAAAHAPIVVDPEDYIEVVAGLRRAMDMSPTCEVLVEEVSDDR